MKRFQRIAVYCASSDDIDPTYFEAASQMGHALADRNIGLVFGGGHIGLMGQIANSMIDRGMEVIGVIPEKLQKLELAHPNCTSMHVVETMHERKQMMINLADAFIALPGGYGTLEELFEVITWAQLNFHRKPVGILNVNGFYDDLIRFVHHAVDEGFVREELRYLLSVADRPFELLEVLEKNHVPELSTWLKLPN